MCTCICSGKMHNNFNLILKAAHMLICTVWHLKGGLGNSLKPSLFTILRLVI